MSEEINRPDKEKDVIADYANELQQEQIKIYEGRLKKGRNALFIAGGLLFLAETIPMFTSRVEFDPLVFFIALGIGGVFVALAIWSRRRPYTAVLTGLIIFTCYILLVLVSNGIANGREGFWKALYTGIFIKAIVLVNLATSLKQAKVLQAAKATSF